MTSLLGILETQPLLIDGTQLYPHICEGDDKGLGKQLLEILQRELGSAIYAGQNPIYLCYSTVPDEQEVHANNVVLVSRCLKDQTSQQIAVTSLKEEANSVISSWRGLVVDPAYRRKPIAFSQSEIPLPAYLNTPRLSDIAALMSELVSYEVMKRDVITANPRSTSVNIFRRNEWTPIAIISGVGNEGDPKPKMLYVKCKDGSAYTPENFCSSYLKEKESTLPLISDLSSNEHHVVVFRYMTNYLLSNNSFQTSFSY